VPSAWRLVRQRQCRDSICSGLRSLSETWLADGRSWGLGLPVTDTLRIGLIPRDKLSHGPQAPDIAHLNGWRTPARRWLPGQALGRIVDMSIAAKKCDGTRACATRELGRPLDTGPRQGHASGSAHRSLGRLEALESIGRRRLFAEKEVIFHLMRPHAFRGSERCTEAPRAPFERPDGAARDAARAESRSGRVGWADSSLAEHDSALRRAWSNACLSPDLSPGEPQTPPKLEASS